MKIESGLEGRRARVDMVPLLDVLLIVLIFFLYLALTLTSRQAIEVALPAAQGRPARAAVTLVVTRDGHVLAGGRVASPTDAVGWALEATRGAADPHVLLRCDRASRLGLTVELMSLLHRAGLDAVSIEVDGR